MVTPDYLLPVAFAVIAFIYASVGFGGGSSYLALLAVAGLPYQELRLTALICNIVVVLGNALVFSSKKQINWTKNWPLVLLSVPLAFLGAKARIQEHTFFFLLGVTLLLAAVLLWIQPEKREAMDLERSPSNPVRDGSIGAGIGLLSGLVGIGGGIFLSPVLHFLNWDTARKIAATASLFILANSIAGVGGQLLSLTNPVNWIFITQLAIAVFLGGQFGLRVSLKTFSPQWIRKITAILVLIASIEVLWKHFLHP